MSYLRFGKLSNAILAAFTLNLFSLPISAVETPLKQVIVVFKDSVDNPQAVAVEQAVANNFNVPFVYTTALKGYAASIPELLIPVLASDSRVAFISEDRPVQATAQTLPTGVERIEGDQSSMKSGDGTGSVNVGVAIIDTGINTSHPDLNVVGGKSCVRGSLNSYNDQNGHGTHVAGTVAAKDNGEGVVGVAPGVPLYAVRVLNAAGSGMTSEVICGIDWVTANAASKGIKVVNMSLSGGGSDDGNCGMTNNDPQHMAICNLVKAGVSVVVAAGNDGVDMAGSTPAAYDEVLTVTAIADFNGQPGGGAASTCRADVDETAADFSNYAVLESDKKHTIAAPGTCIYSTWLTGLVGTPISVPSLPDPGLPVSTNTSGYNTISGTSMASPHVAGAVALCIASGRCANLTPEQIITKLRNDAAAQPTTYGFTDDPNSPNGTRYYGHLMYTGGY
jgi:subtilisin family serine protease